MIRSVLLEMTLLTPSKETEKKLRWCADIEGTSFELYIPKWRVPHPYPARIIVSIHPKRGRGDDPNLSPEDVKGDGLRTHEPIVSTVNRFKACTKTIHYKPVGDDKTWEIGEPYIPIEMTFDESPTLRIIVIWDLLSRGAFQGNIRTPSREEMSF